MSNFSEVCYAYNYAIANFHFQYISNLYSLAKLYNPVIA